MFMLVVLHRLRQEVITVGHFRLSLRASFPSLALVMGNSC